MPSTRNTRHFCSLLISFALLLGLCACSLPPDKSSCTLFAMDTYMSLTAYGENAEAGLEAAADALRSLDKLLDPETEGSAVYRLNHGETVQDEAVLSMLHTCEAVYEASGGAFDPTVYPLVKAWGFVDAQYHVPTEAEIQTLLECVDFAQVTVTNTGAGLPDGMALNFGAVAKGYAAQHAADAMRAAGVESGILSLGGNVQTLGEKPGGGLWEIAVQDPFDESVSVGTLSVGGGTAVITSGSYRRFFEQDGKTYHHIFDPRSGYPCDSDLRSVTVVCQDGALADALSTALFVLGEEAALRLQAELDTFELLLITEDGRIVLTGGLSDVFTPRKDSPYVLSYPQ
ncbi:MAG: FAD:protein FMN transferase [Oscillospiraceae bacterium]|nr:FAD:protein FMN transferase [Oscillospiraceae bacterium]